MAGRRGIPLVDDLDGSTGQVTAVQFSLDGLTYEINLTGDRAAVLRALINGYAAHARRASEPSRRIRQGGSGHAARIRAWAAEAGYYVSPGGSVPHGIEVAFLTQRPLPPSPPLPRDEVDLLEGLIA